MTPSPWWDKARHADRKPFLDARAAILRAVRDWFAGQGFTEVEPAMLVASPGAETHIEAFEVDGRYLHTSPEFAMKRLLAAGETRIFYLGKTWRRGETGPLHAPEFTMLEWYRAGAPYEAIMDDCVEVARVAARAANAAMLRWRDKSCDPFTAAERITVRQAFAELSPIELPSDGDAFSAAIVKHVEPNLGDGALTLLTEYPIAEAALARPCPHDASVAERFELYACGVELANGFGELTDPVEQRRRLVAAMEEKQKRYGKRWPIDEEFLAALAHMPPSSGVALGFDRLVMLATGARHINDVLWTPQG
ncbi:EF-P lysine aminoacylase EpmA [Terricaulis silvestris]|uniref:Elongation factor P--(R)-beta-lysine ligase n=1 Tax=Terricaulis silvestris TaxID=2686094 RepID=A0A6I6MFL1_9CAUL|nr:EF-P lysine aminoacylase EpmA [Terricaulis silvestris]QGZ93250.1 Elongation factor P--(R)-beta-lysine ligase [Terricaulis silvestris]